MDEFAETAVLIDVMNGDEEAVLARLRGFLPNELNTFDEQLQELRHCITHVQRYPKEPS